MGDGYRVTAGDDSVFHLAQIRGDWDERTVDDSTMRQAAVFDQTDPFETGYPDGSFDAVICEGVLPRLAESFSRIALLAELGRVTKGWVVVSFANSATVQGLCLRLQSKTVARGRNKVTPISLRQLRREARKAGLHFSAMLGTQGPIAARCYAIFCKVATGDVSA